MYEELFGKGKNLPSEVYESIYVGHTLKVDFEAIEFLINTYKTLNKEELKETMMYIVYAE